MDHDLAFHGDRDVAAGLVDLAVNVRVPRPPDWLVEVINSSTAELAHYPRTDATRSAIAAAHSVPVGSTLPTAGGAEAFTLVARALRPHRPVVVHPQFTEPEAALIAAGHRPERLLLDPQQGFTLDGPPGERAVPAGADLVMIGNPTNPTGVLHPARSIRALLRSDRVVVVDEAFMDAVPGQSESVIAEEMPGLVVLRSLTKTWGLAGLRAGYAVGDPRIISAMAAQQPPWAVSTPALAATRACLDHAALAIAEAAAAEIADHRAYLVRTLGNLGLSPAAQSQAPFVLVDTAGWAGDRSPGWVRAALRGHGLAVRRGETFPGLGPDWVRIAVRRPDVTDRLAAALVVLRRQSRNASPRVP
jgi:cobyrinic acid a,c-diamide synthase